MQMLFMAHSGVRYLVLLAALVAIGYYGFALVSKKPAVSVGRMPAAVFAGLLDLQILLGILLMATGLFYPALMGHLFMMIIAAVVAHVSFAIAKKSSDADRSVKLRLIGVAGALVLIVLGIGSIGRSVFGSGAPTLVE